MVTTRYHLSRAYKDRKLLIKTREKQISRKQGPEKPVACMENGENLRVV